MPPRFSAGNRQLPADLREKIEALLGADERAKLSAAAQDVSLKYRREASANLQISSLAEAKAYVATRLPATWCAVTDVLSRLLDVDPGFAPQSLLDLGAGPGTASLAAQNLWPDIEAALIEPNAHLRAVGGTLVEGNWTAQTLQALEIERDYDLAIASYVFNELTSDFTALLEKIWKRTGTLVLIEPGTPHGYETILKARDYFLSIGANIAAPCPHHNACPLQGLTRWCHFSVRVDRSKIHRQVKADARLSYEDEKFSYLVVTRKTLEKPHFRALGEPHGQKVIGLEVCRDDGTFRVEQVSRRDRDYKPIRKMSWGDAAFGEEIQDE